MLFGVRHSHISQDMLSPRWPALSDTAHYIRELIDTTSRNPLGHNGNAYDINVLKELDCLVTQRRMHSIHHRNIPFPHQDKPGPMSDTTSQASEDFLNDDTWWHAFIHDDSYTEETNFSPSNPIPSTSITTQEQPRQAPEPQKQRISRHDTSVELEEIISAIPACSFCRDRHIKCHQQLPACRECLRSSRECLVYDPIMDQNVPLRYSIQQSTL